MGLFELFKKKNSGGVAKDRLKLLLVSDRANCSPDVMDFSHTLNPVASALWLY